MIKWKSIVIRMQETIWTLKFLIIQVRAQQLVPVDDIKLRPPIFKFTLKIQAKIVFFKGKITYI